MHDFLYTKKIMVDNTRYFCEADKRCMSERMDDTERSVQLPQYNKRNAASGPNTLHSNSLCIRYGLKYLNGGLTG